MRAVARAAAHVPSVRADRVKHQSHDRHIVDRAIVDYAIT